MNAIISAATGYSAKQLVGFLESARRHCKDTKVYLIIYRQDHDRLKHLELCYPQLEFLCIKKKLRLRRAYKLQHALARAFSRIGLHKVMPIQKKLGRYLLHIALDRYFIAQELLQTHRNAFSNVLLADCRDVVFQDDPFTRLGDTIVTGIEEQCIGNSQVNADWIRDLGGKSALLSMSNKIIICSGVTLGRTAKVEQYLDLMCQRIWRCLPQIMSEYGYDQGVHMQLIYENDMPVTLTSNQDGIIATLGYGPENNVATDTANGRIQVRGKCPCIVHQYDRYPNLVAFVESMYMTR